MDETDGGTAVKRVLLTKKSAVRIFIAEYLHILGGYFTPLYFYE